ncbi:MAG: GumC family protein [Hyphomicrobium sp.]
MLERQSSIDIPNTGDGRGSSRPPRIASAQMGVDPGTNMAGFFAILARYLPSIAMAGATGLGLALLYLASSTPIYTASTTLFIDPRNRKIVSEEVVQGGLGSDFALVESQVNIIGSDAVLGRVVDKLNLTEDPEFASAPASGGMLSRLKAIIRGQPATVEPRIRALEAVARNLKVKRAQKTYVVEIETASSSPIKAARLTNAIVDAYIEDQSAAKADEARKANTLIDSRLGELREQVRKAETRVDEYKKANKILSSEGGIVSEQQLGKLNAELITSRAVAAESKARLEQANAALKSGASPDTLPEAMKSGLVQKLRDQYAQVARRQAALASQLRDKHPVLIEVRSQIAEIRAQIAAELKRVTDTAKNDFQIATTREREIAGALDRLKEEVGRSNTAQIKLRELEQEVNASRELLRQYLARAKETEEEQKLSTSQARIISPAAVPSSPSRPIAWLVLALGSLAGLGLGIARALALDHFDPTVTSLREAAEAAGTEPLVAIPPLRPSMFAGWMPASIRFDTFDQAAFSELMTAISDVKGYRSSSYRQAVLQLLNRIVSRTAPGQPTSVLFLAPSGESGTSATALAVAYAAALNGEKVLLVDAASANATLSTIFAAELKDDEVVVLDNKEHLARIVTRDTKSGLAFLPIALADLRTLKTAQRRRLVAGLRALAKDFDLVVIDGGALLEDESGASLTAAADQVIVVAKARSTSRYALAEAARLIDTASDRVEGVVLNMARSELS